MNQVNFAGNVTAEPVVKDVNGAALVEFSVAINEKYKNKAGEEVKEVSFIDVKAWRWTAHCAKQAHKGDMVTISGKLKHDRWEDATTKQNRSKVYVVAAMIGIVPKSDAAAAPAAAEQAPF
jgi:single-strand DNA-binding protein